MKINFNQAANYVYLATTEWPSANWQRMHAQLESFDWEHMAPSGGQHAHAVQTIYTPSLWDHPGQQDPEATAALIEFQQFFDAKFKQQLLDILFNDHKFLGHWGMPDRACFDRITNLGTHWVLTPANFTQHQWHVDSRMQVAFGMIYFTLADNYLTSTWFDTGQPGHLLRAPCGPGQGWMIVNCDEARHCGMNDMPSARYSLKFSLDLRLRPYMWD